MISSRQRAYLDAMDIGVWSLREAPPVAIPPESLPEVQPEIQPEASPETSPEASPEASPDTPIASPVQALPPGLKLGPGGGGILLVCAVDTDSASRLANDISRALGSVPVWAWPHADADAVKLATAIEGNLFTTVGVFGSDLAAQFFKGDMPASLQSANLVLLPSMQEIQGQSDARRQLWAAFCRSGMVSASSPQR